MAETTTAEDAEMIEKVRLVLGPDPLDSDILRALSLVENNPNAAINIILDTPGFLRGSVTVKRTSGGSGARIYTELKREMPEVPGEMEEGSDSNFESVAVSDRFQPLIAKKGQSDICNVDLIDLENPHFTPYLNPLPISSKKPSMNTDRRIQVYSELNQVENGEFPEEPDWFLLGRTNVVGLSTCRGRKLEFYEIVHFSFPSVDVRRQYSGQWVSAKAAVARSEIVRFSTKRSGEVMNFNF